MFDKTSIYKVMADGSVKGIYCDGRGGHYGYFATNSFTLNKYYRDPQKVDNLVSLGNILALGKKVEPSEFAIKYGSDICNEEFNNLPQDKQDSLYDESFDHVCAYHRDYQEQLEHPRTYTSLDKLEEMMGSQMRRDLVGYVYVMAPKEGKDASSANPDDWEWLTSRLEWKGGNSTAYVPALMNLEETVLDPLLKELLN